MGHGTVQWEFYIRTEKTGVDRETSTKNGLDNGRTENFTRHIYRTQSASGDEGAVEWMDENGEVVAYEKQVVKKRDKDEDKEREFRSIFRGDWPRTEDGVDPEKNKEGFPRIQ